MRQKGQALTEMAIITPILIFFLIGLFEVGWALRGYLVLTNLNRESARYAVRTNVLDFNSSSIGYEKIVTHTLNTLGNQLDLNFQDKGTMIISRVFVDAPCMPPYTITTPLNTPTYTIKFPPTSPHQTRIDYIAVAYELTTFQISHSCDLIAKGLIPKPNDVIIVEIWYEQPQLFGFPLISNPLTDPIPMYAHSAFRRIQESRE